MLFDSLVHGSKELREADSFRRVELLRITDQRYRALSRRAGMWLAETRPEAAVDADIIEAFLKQALLAYANNPDASEVRILIDEEIQRRNVQRALERKQGAQQGIAVEIGLTGRFLVLRKADLDRKIESIDKTKIASPELRVALKKKQGIERRKALLRCVKSAAPLLLGELVRALPLGAEG